MPSFSPPAAIAIAPKPGHGRNWVRPGYRVLAALPWPAGMAPGDLGGGRFRHGGRHLGGYLIVTRGIPCLRGSAPRTALRRRTRHGNDAGSTQFTDIGGEVSP
jgi:hypothetical protein